MSSFGDVAEIEAELTQRNREIAKVRDALSKSEKEVQEWQMRNGDLLEANSSLDAEVTTHKSAAERLNEKIAGLEATIATMAEATEELKKEHEMQLEALKGHISDLEDGRNGASEQEREARMLMDREIEDSKAGHAATEAELEKERTLHAASKGSLETAEANSREMAGRAVEQRRRIKELEEDFAAKQESISAEEAQRLTEERQKAADELATMARELEEHKGIREDLEKHVKEHDESHHTMKAELEDRHAQIADHANTVAELEAARDEALRKHEEATESHQEKLHAHSKRHEEHLEKATSQAAALDGRLNGQRMMMEMTNDALKTSEANEARLVEELAEKAKELESHKTEFDGTRASLEEAKEQAAQAAAARESQFRAEFASEEVSAKQHARTEIDVATRATAEAEERHRSLEAQVASLRSDREEADLQQNRSTESHAEQRAEHRSQHAELQDKHSALERDIERLQREVEEARLEAERATLTHKNDAERLQQTLEADQQSRQSAEVIAQSKLEEKDTLIEHRDAAIERLEQEVKEAKEKITHQDEAYSKLKDEHSAKVSQQGIRQAETEAELRVKHERIMEIEARLDAQRAHVEEVNSTLVQTQTDKDTLEQHKGSLEAQLKLELGHKDAVLASLQQHQIESELRVEELENQLQTEREQHKEAIEDTRGPLAEELKLVTDKLATSENEHKMSQQRCEVLMRNKNDFQQEIADHKSKHTSLEAAIGEHRSQSESASLELEQVRTQKESLEQDVSRMSEERRQCDRKLEELTEKVRAAEEQGIGQADDFTAKVQKLDELLNAERRLREAAESSLAVARQDNEQRSGLHDSERRGLEKELRDTTALLDTWREKTESTDTQLRQARSEGEGHRERAEAADKLRRQQEQDLHDKASTAEARLRRLEQEAQRAQTQVEEGQAAMAQQSATMTAKIAALERRLVEEASAAQAAHSGRQSAEAAASGQEDGKRQLTERLSMAAEELGTRHAGHVLEKQRLTGALDESRRALRNTLGAPSPVAAQDGVRISALEQQLADERKKSVEQAVALQRAERKAAQLEEQQKRNEDQRSGFSQQARDAEKKSAAIAEDLRKLQAARGAADQRCEEARESAAMTAAEMHTVRYDKNYEIARLRGSLDELRYMIKMAR